VSPVRLTELCGWGSEGLLPLLALTSVTVSPAAVLQGHESPRARTWADLVLANRQQLCAGIQGEVVNAGSPERARAVAEALLRLLMDALAQCVDVCPVQPPDRLHSSRKDAVRGVALDRSDVDDGLEHALLAVVYKLLGHADRGMRALAVEQARLFLCVCV
jgi:hypothetical protein